MSLNPGHISKYLNTVQQTESYIDTSSTTMFSDHGQHVEGEISQNIDLKGTFCISHNDEPVTFDEDYDIFTNNKQTIPTIKKESILSAKDEDINVTADTIGVKNLHRIIEDEVGKLEISNHIPNVVSCLKLCDQIKDRVKRLPSTRYKYIVHITTGDCSNQDLRVTSRCMWDDKTDRVCSLQFSNYNKFLVVNVYALYVQ